MHAVCGEGPRNYNEPDSRLVPLKKNYALVCDSCGSTYQNDTDQLCESCRVPLNVQYDLFSVTIKPKELDTGKRMWQFRQLLPVYDDEELVSMGEGQTPLVWGSLENTVSPKIAFKVDYLNPTLSFKDRGASLLLTKAKSAKFRSVLIDSSGNAASAVAAYSARAGIDCHAFIPVSTSPNKIYQISAYGASVSKIEGTRQDVLEAARAFADKTHGYYCGFQFNPFATEATKSIAYEIAQEMNWDAPDYVIVPIGTGGLLIGCSKGFEDLRNLGWISGRTKIIGVQPEGCSPIVEAFLTKGEIKPMDHPETIAEGLKIGHPHKGQLAVKEIVRSGGRAIIVSDTEILEAVRYLARKHGIFAEPSGAASTAGLLKLSKEEFFSKSDKIICVVTGSGLKSGKLYV